MHASRLELLHGRLCRRRRRRRGQAFVRIAARIGGGEGGGSIGVTGPGSPDPPASGSAWKPESRRASGVPREALAGGYVPLLLLTPGVERRLAPEATGPRVSRSFPASPSWGFQSRPGVETRVSARSGRRRAGTTAASSTPSPFLSRPPSDLARNVRPESLSIELRPREAAGAVLSGPRAWLPLPPPGWPAPTVLVGPSSPLVAPPGGGVAVAEWCRVIRGGSGVRPGCAPRPVFRRRRFGDALGTMTQATPRDSSQAGGSRVCSP